MILKIKKATAPAAEFAADKIFDEISLKVKSNPQIVKTVNAVYEFHVTKGDETKVFVADLKKGEVGIKGSGASPKPQCTILLKDADFVSLATGTAKPQQVQYSFKYFF